MGNWKRNRATKLYVFALEMYMEKGREKKSL